MLERELSQSELARRIGVSQASIYRLVAGEAYGSKHLHRIARELGTTPAYLAGETDDPHADAPPPPPEPRVQSVTLSVLLPSERALAAAYRGLLRASRGMEEDELARELAKRLPTIIRAAEGALPGPASDDDDDDLEAAAAPDGEQPPARRARRT